MKLKILERTLGSQKGVATNIVMTLVVVAVVILVGAMVFSNIDSSMDTSDLTNDAQEAINTTKANTYIGFNLMSIMPIVLAAGGILGAIFLYLAPRR